MKSSDNLFQLIKTLTKAEKKNFKSFAFKQKGDKKYLKLFDAIDSLHEYDELLLKKKFHNEKFIKQLSSIKNYLYNLILKSLEVHHRNVAAGLKGVMIQVDILFGKSLYKQCSALLNRAKVIAYKHERFMKILEIIDKEKRLIDAQGYRIITNKNMNELIKEETVILERINNRREYENLRYKIFEYYVKNDIARNKKEEKHYQRIVDNPLCTNEYKALSYDAKTDFFFIQGVYYYSTGNIKECYKYRKKLVEFIESQPERMRGEEMRYLSALINLYSVAIQCGYYDECLSAINKMRTLSPDALNNKIFAFRGAYIHALDLYIHNGEFKKGISFIKNIEDGLQNYKGKIQASSLIVFYINIAYTYFGIEDYSNAVKWLNKIINDIASDVRTDINCFARILYLITHYELGNAELLEYIVKSTYRFLYKRNRLYRFETCVLNFIKKSLPKANTQQKLINSFEDLKQELEDVTKEPLEKKALEYFDFISWLESKIENRPFAEIVKEKVKKITPSQT